MTSKPTYTDTTVSPTGSYQYQVTAVDHDSDESIPVTVTVNANGVAPATPASPSATPTSATSIKLTWSRGTGSDPVQSFKIYRSGGTNPSYAPIATIIATADTSYAIDDFGLSWSTAYSYRIYAVDAAGLMCCPAATASTSTLAGANSAPFLSIASPQNASFSSDGTPIISADTQLMGIVSFPGNNLRSWTLYLKLQNAGATSTDKVKIASGTWAVGGAPATAGFLATIQPTLFQDGLYQLELDATDTSNVTTTTSDGPLIKIKTDAKLGNFTLPVTDLELDVPGYQPI